METLLLTGTLMVPLLGAVLGVAAAHTAAGKRLLSGLALLNLLLAATLAVQTTLGRPHLVPGPWGLALVGDRLGAVFVLLAAGIQATVLPYAARCLEGKAFGRFAAFSQVLAAATDLTGIAATPATLALGWVAAGVAVYALVAGGGDAPAAARRVGWAFLLGDGALVGAVLLLCGLAGNPTLAHLPAAAVPLAAVRFPVGPLVVTAGDAAALLIVLAAVVRSALWPGPRWLPATLAAPTPVSALLHAGVVNAGGFLLIRLSPLLGATPAADSLALIAGLATAAFGGVAAVVRSDVKGSLVYSTMSQMGFMIAECAVGAFAAAVFHLVAHAMYKAALFLGSGDGLAEAVRQRRTPRQRTAAVARLRPVLAAGGALGLVAAALVLDPSSLAHWDARVTVAFAAVGIGSLLWGFAGRRQTLAPTMWGALGLVAAGAGYLLWSSAVAAWLAPQLPSVSTAFRSPVWLLAGLAAAGAVAVWLAATAWRSAPAVRLRAWAFWAAWGRPVWPQGTPVAVRGDAWEVGSSWKQPV